MNIDRRFDEANRKRKGTTIQINVSIPKELNNQLRKEAKEVNRSFSNYIAWILINRQAVEKEGNGI